MQENNYPPSIIFTTENPLSKLFLSIVERFSNFLQQIVCLQLNEIENFRETPLSESRNTH